MSTYVAAWRERDSGYGIGAAGSWRPMPFEQAREKLVTELARNLDYWMRAGMARVRNMRRPWPR